MSADMDRLRDIMALLRDPEKGCPWDVEQTFAGIAPHTIEEAYEVADAVERGDMSNLEEELGDLLLQVVFFARMAEEEGIFDLDGVARAICTKLVSRHPHVFGDATIKDADAQLRAWEGYKAQERKEERKEERRETSALDGVAMALPALTRAVKLQKRAARVGFDWDEAAGVLDKMAEETAELGREMAADASADRIEDETGDLLFTCVNLARKLGVDPEQALRRANAKFDARFRRMEMAAADGGDSADFAAESADKLEERWRLAKEGD